MLLATALLATACGSGGRGGGTAEVELVSDVERARPSGDGPVADLVTGLTDFTFAFQREVTDPDQNLVFSPASIAVAFAMARAGASDETAATLEEAFGFPEGSGVHEAMNDLLQQLDLDREGLTLSVADRGWARTADAIGQAFLDTIAAHYGAGLGLFDEDDEVTRREINAWIAEQTHGRIPELLPPGFIDSSTVFALVNAVYFDGDWAQPFGLEVPTAPVPFTTAAGDVVDAPTMHNPNLEARALQEDGLDVVAIPYVDELSMVVAQPDDLGAFVDGLDGATWTALVDRLQPATVDLSLPTWDIESTIDLSEPMTALGVGLPGGDYSGIAPGLVLGKGIHGADITVDEEGTVAAAATVLAFRERAISRGDLHIEVDHPFLYAIVHDPTGLVVFSGQIVDPTA